MALDLCSYVIERYLVHGTDVYESFIKSGFKPQHISFSGYDDDIITGREILAGKSILSVSEEEEHKLKKYGLHSQVTTKHDVGKALRNMHMHNGTIWVGAEVESVNDCIQLGRRAILTNINVSLPNFSNIMDLSIMRKHAPSSGLRTFGTVRICEQLYDSGFHSDVVSSEREIMSLLLPFWVKTLGVFIIVGSTVDISFNKYPNILNYKNIIVISPIRPEFECRWINKAADVDSVLADIKENVSGSLLSKSFVYIDISGYRTDSESLDDIIRKDAIEMSAMAGVFKTYGMDVLIKYFISPRTLNAAGIRIPPLRPPDKMAYYYVHVDNHFKTVKVPYNELKCVLNKIRIRADHEKEFVSECQRIRQNIAIKRVSPKSFLHKPSVTVGMYSLMNTFNHIDNLISFVHKGGKMNIYFRSIFEDSVRTTEYGNTKFSDHSIDCIDQFKFPYIYPIWNTLQMSSNPILNQESVRTMLLCGAPLTVEQGYNFHPNLMIKGISVRIRTKLDDPEYVYIVRSEVANTVILPWDGKISNVTNRSYHYNGQKRSVSGHLMYTMIGEVLGMGQGMRRLFYEKLWNAKGVEGNELPGQWHYSTDDYLATHCAQRILLKMHIQISSVNYEKITSYCQAVRNLIEELWKNCEEYR